MNWYQPDEEEDDLMFSPALLARRASESWIDSAPIEVDSLYRSFIYYCITDHYKSGRDAIASCFSSSSCIA
jgi:hypothetical protein